MKLWTRPNLVAFALSLTLWCALERSHAAIPGAQPSIVRFPPITVAEAPCVEDMVLVEGQYCTQVEQRCVRWLDDPRLPFARCGTYAEPVLCVGKRVPMRYCIDRYEYTKPGEVLPVGGASFNEAERVCSALDKRVCSEAEWTFACEGEQMLPYPYGFSRAPVCNQDRQPLVKASPNGSTLIDWREPATGRPECVSPFGVFNMAGNLDEPVLRDSPPADPRFRAALKGGWWMPARNRCRPATTGHDVNYASLQVGIRCCATAAD